jgi:hypothetical protein
MTWRKFVANNEHCSHSLTFVNPSVGRWKKTTGSAAEEGWRPLVVEKGDASF